MKRSLSVLVVLCLLLTSGALALTDAERATLAQPYIPADAVFLKEKTDDGMTELKYETADKSAEYELKLDPSGAVSKVKYDLRNDVGGATRALTDEAAFAVVQKAFPDATLVAVKQKTDDGRYETKVTFSTPSLTGEYTLNAENGAVMEYELYPLSAAKPDEAAAQQLLQAQYPGAVVQTAEKGKDDGRDQYEGKAAFEGRVYEFEIDASSGKVTEWERDD